MDYLITGLILSLLLLRYMHNAKTVACLVNLKPTPSELGGIIHALDIQGDDELIFFSYIYRRRRAYLSEWATLRLAYNKIDSDLLHEAWERLQDEAVLDTAHRPVNYSNYRKLCYTVIQTNWANDKSPVELVSLFKPAFESEYGKNGDNDALVRS